MNSISLQGGFLCKRRLTRHDWNDGNNNLAEVLLDEVHDSEGRAAKAAKSRVVCQTPLHASRLKFSQPVSYIDRHQHFCFTLAL
ncbi:hypothetical protein BZK31_26660 [Pseudomonas floridensis]|uniref:Uncharacterized protein n=1 Tax=Pseudomonas floridensis TaxID=1958950 RepID=A0A1X0MY20_9PSED|nr:hypothetical protein BZK31_26660 [Pseudomonas floridensis]